MGDGISWRWVTGGPWGFGGAVTIPFLLFSVNSKPIELRPPAPRHGNVGGVNIMAYSFFFRVVVVMLGLNRWLVLGFFIVPMFTLAPSLLIAPGLEWARRGAGSVFQKLTFDSRVSFPPQ